MAKLAESIDAVPASMGRQDIGQPSLLIDAVKPFDFAQHPFCGSSGTGMPWSIMGEHGIGSRDEFAHGGDDGDLRRFPLFAQVFVERPDDGIAADGDSCRHIEAAAS